MAPSARGNRTGLPPSRCILPDLTNPRREARQEMDQAEIDRLLAEFREALAAAGSPEDVAGVQRAFVGKKSAVKNAMSALGKLPKEDRREVAARIHAARALMEKELAAVGPRIEREAMEARLRSEWVDLSLPGVGPRRGARHPVNLVERTCLAVMRQLGFELVDGPEVESAYYNFDALNVPEHHPARDMQDTFWVEGGGLLRSHTTTVQARVLEGRPELPVKVASAGRVYRNEAVDATHLAMFHQLEGFWLDRGTTFAEFKGVLEFVARALYGDRPVRFKPKFYPYTEPSVGMDVQCGNCGGDGCQSCHQAGWVTIIGAGMIHRNVLVEFGYDPDEVSGFAFGWGTTRMATQWTGVPKARPLYEGDLRLLESVHLRGAR